MIKTSSMALFEQWEFWGIKVERLVDPLETETSKRRNGLSSTTKKVTTNFWRRCVRKEQWTKLYNQKSDKEFLEKMRINRTTFNLLLNTLWDGQVLTPTNFVPEPTSPDRQLAASQYRLAHRVTYTIFEDVFGISKELGCVFFNKVIRLIVAYFYEEYVKLPETDEQWEVEVCGFIENCSFQLSVHWMAFISM